MIDKRPSVLPSEVRRLALRLGATDEAKVASVFLTQTGSMSDTPTSRLMSFKARQTINLLLPEFEWRASTGPFGCISIVDALTEGTASLEVRLFGAIPITAVNGGSAAIKGEVMRYLAELPWAPDAILRNSSLRWTVVNDHTFLVSTSVEQINGQVELRLDADGRIGSVRAPDRPRKEGKKFVEREWHGRFFEYRRHQNRWLPFRGEVGWVLNGNPFVVGRGQITSWKQV